jgi:alpha-N-arabinofuranosidase
MGPLLVVFALIVLVITAPMMAAQKVELSIDASKTGAKIDRNIFGQFAEHLWTRHLRGHLGRSDSKIPNTRGIRNDVVGALRTIKVPNVRWPGGCFADEYHWRKGIGPQRSVTLNPNRGGRR